MAHVLTDEQFSALMDVPITKLTRDQLVSIIFTLQARHDPGGDK